MLRAIRLGEQRFLRDPALVPERLQLPGVDAVAVQFEPLLDEPRQREIHVVAAEQDVIANRDALEREVAVVLADENQAEVGGAAADVAHQHEVADAKLPPPRVAGAVDPGVARGLRLFEQRDVLQPGRFRGAQRQLARVLVERRRHGEEHLLPVERQRRILRRDLRVPRLPQMPQVCGRRRHRRQLRHRRPARPTAGSPPCGPAPACDSHDFADDTSRVGLSAPRFRASSPTMCGGDGRLPREGAGCRPGNRIRRRRRGTREAG